MTSQQKKIMKNAKNVYLDGTFKIVTKPFVQLYSINVFINQDENIKQVPVCFILMTQRQTFDYKLVFTQLRTILEVIVINQFPQNTINFTLL